MCEVAGLGPVSTQAVLDVMDSGDPVLKAVVTKGKDVVGVAHLGRRPTAHQQSALDWMFPTCAAEGCGTRAGHLGDRPPPRVGQEPLYGAAVIGPAVQVPPPPEDLSGLGAGSRAGPAGASCRPTTPATLVTTWRRRRLRRREPRALGVKLRTASNGRSHRRARPAPVYRGPSQS